MMSVARRSAPSSSPRRTTAGVDHYKPLERREFGGPNDDSYIRFCRDGGWSCLRRPQGPTCLAAKTLRAQEVTPAHTLAGAITWPARSGFPAATSEGLIENATDSSRRYGHACRMTSMIGRVRTAVLDAADMDGDAQFWSALVHIPVVHRSDDSTTLQGRDIRLAVQPRPAGLARPVPSAAVPPRHRPGGGVSMPRVALAVGGETAPNRSWVPWHHHGLAHDGFGFVLATTTTSRQRTDRDDGADVAGNRGLGGVAPFHPAAALTSQVPRHHHREPVSASPRAAVHGQLSVAC